MKKTIQKKQLFNTIVYFATQKQSTIVTTPQIMQIERH